MPQRRVLLSRSSGKDAAWAVADGVTHVAFGDLAHAGPMFARPLEVRVGEVVERDGFRFADVRCADR